MIFCVRISDAGKDAEPENKKKVVDTGPDLSVLRVRKLWTLVLTSQC